MSSVSKTARGTWIARVRPKGRKGYSKTFSRKALADAWADGQERDIEQLAAGVMPTSKAYLLRALIGRYEEEIGAAKPFGRNKLDVLKKIKEHLGDEPAGALTAERIVKYILKDRKISGVTAAIDLTYLKGILKVCRALWRLPVQPHVVDDAREMLKYLGKIGKSDDRDRRPTLDEIDRIKGWLDEHSKTLTRDHIDFILDSCFRPPSELTRLGRSTINRVDKTIVIVDRKDPKKKLGNNQTVPLLGRCLKIIDRQPVDPRRPDIIFAVNGKSWSSIFPRACEALGIVDLRLYDLRHEAISRLVEANKHSIAEMMLITGHKDPKQLMRYTQIRARNLHR